MLVLSRQKDESIMIGDDVEIIIVDVRGDKVRLGITAPRSIPVHRREIYDAIQREKSEKAQEQEQQDKQEKELKAPEEQDLEPKAPEQKETKTRSSEKPKKAASG
jgi:carbon storage regulator